MGDKAMIDANVISNISCRCVVDRKIHTSTRVIQFLLYFSVFVFVVIGMYGGFLWLIPTLGTLFFAWYFMGEHRVSHEHQLDGTMFTVIRYSGVRQKPKVVKFMELDLKELILISEDGTSRTEEIEAISAKAQPKRITYYLNAQDPNRPSLVLYARGYGDEAGRYVKAYINPSAEMINNMKLVAPGKVFSYEI